MVERVEALEVRNEESELIDSTREELSDLSLSIGPDKRKDWEKFNKLSQDSDVKKGIEKVYEKSCKIAFSEEWKKFEKINIGKTLENVVKKYPSLWLKISGDLGLPLGEPKFSKLTTQQKVNFTALYDAIHGNNLLYKKNPSAKDIETRISRNINLNMNKVNGVFKRTNQRNLLNLQKTLKNDFKLTDEEAKKMEEYLLLVKKYPEFLGEHEVVKSGVTPYIIIGVIGIILGAIGMHRIDNMGKEKTDTTSVLNGTTTIENPEKVLRLLTQEAEFKNGGNIELSPEYDNAIIDVLEEIPLIRHVVKLSKEQIKSLQTKEIKMEFSGKLAMQFDLDQGCSIDIVAKDGKGKAYVMLPKPSVIVTDSRAKIVDVDRELVHRQAYDQAEENLRKDLEKKAINDALRDPDFLEKGRQDITQQLKDLFVALRPEGIDIVDVEVEFFDPMEDMYTDRPKTPKMPPVRVHK